MPRVQDLPTAPSAIPCTNRRVLIPAALASLGCLTLVSGPLLASAGASLTAAPVPRIVEVPSRPAFLRPPSAAEAPAQAGQVLKAGSLLRTELPGRLQVLLANGRSFRLGGNAVARLGADGVAMERGQIIAWVNPGAKRGAPLRIRTRVATASILGTTVFLDVNAETVKVFSWEGHVSVTTGTGRRFELHSGQQVAFENGAWQPPRRLSPAELVARRQASLLLNGFRTPMETLPVIERELGLAPPPAEGPQTPP